MLQPVTWICWVHKCYNPWPEYYECRHVTVHVHKCYNPWPEYGECIKCYNQWPEYILVTIYNLLPEYGECINGTTVKLWLKFDDTQMLQTVAYVTTCQMWPEYFEYMYWNMYINVPF